MTTTPGYELHGNPMYGGAFMAFALGELTSVQVGNAQAAVDEYERYHSPDAGRWPAEPATDRAHETEPPADPRAGTRRTPMRRSRSSSTAAS